MTKTGRDTDEFTANQSVAEQGTTDSRDQSLTDNFKRFIGDVSHGAALVGVASIDRFDEAPRGHGPRDFIPDANAVVVIGIPIVEGLMGLDRFMEGSEVIKEEDTYVDKDGIARAWNPRIALRAHIERRNSHEIINIELQILSMHGAIFLEKEGFKSLYLPTTYGQTFSWPSNTDRNHPRAPEWFGPFSHRHAAVAAGLGEFGLNNLLVTKEYGPRIRIVSIITQAPLVADPLIQEPICLGEKCSLCVKSCRGGAFGEIYELNVGGHLNRLARMNREDCIKVNQICYKKCVRACPVGLKFKKTGS